MTSLTLNQRKINNYIIIAALKSKPMGELINKNTRFGTLEIKFARLCSENVRKPCVSRSVLEALPDKLDIKIHSPSILNLLCVTHAKTIYPYTALMYPRAPTRSGLCPELSVT